MPAPGRCCLPAPAGPRRTIPSARPRPRRWREAAPTWHLGLPAAHPRSCPPTPHPPGPHPRPGGAGKPGELAHLGPRGRAAGWAARARRGGGRGRERPGRPGRPAAAAPAGWHPPVQVVDEVSHVVGQDDAVLAHVAVVPQHAHRHVRRHFGKLPEDVVEGPWEARVGRDPP